MEAGRLPDIQQRLRGCATKYIGAKLNRYMYRFLIDSKQKNLDVFFEIYPQNCVK